MEVTVKSTSASEMSSVTRVMSFIMLGGTT